MLALLSSNEVKLLKLTEKVTSLQVKVRSFLFTLLLPKSKCNLLK